MSCFRFSLFTRHRGEKVPPICDALCPISINTALSEKLQSAITGDMSAPKRLYKCCVLGCTNEHRSNHNLPSSEPRTLWLNFIFFEGNILEKKSVTSPRAVRYDDIYRMDEIKSLLFHILLYRLFRGVAKFIVYGNTFSSFG